MKRLNYKGRKPGAAIRAGKSIQEISVLNTGIEHFNNLLQENGTETKISATFDNRRLLSQALTGSEKIEVKIKGEIFSEDKDGREVLWDNGEHLRLKIAEDEREQKDFEVPSAKGPIVDYDSRYFEKVMQVRQDAVTSARLTRAIQKASENADLYLSYFPELTDTPDKIKEIKHAIEFEARRNPEDYPGLRSEIAKIKDNYAGVREYLGINSKLEEEELNKVFEALDAQELDEIKSLLRPLVP